MTKMRYIYIAAILLLAALSIFWWHVNITVTPRSYHLMSAVLNFNKSFFRSPHEFIINKNTSSFIFKNKTLTPNPCDIVILKNGKYIRNENGSLNMLIAAHADKRIDEESFDEMLEFLTRKCSVDGFYPEQILTPLYSSISNKDIYLVKFLVSRGASLKIPINWPGKEVDGMNAFQFAEYLRNRSNNNDDKYEYEEIINFLKATSEQKR